MIFSKFFLFFLFLYSVLSAQENSCSKWIILPHESGIHSTMDMCRTASSFGAVGDGITDDTDALMEAFSSGVNLDLEGKKYLIDVSKPGSMYGLIPSNNTIIEGHGAEIILKPNNLPVYAMISLVNSKNINIYDLTLTGDVKNHFESDLGEWGMGFWIQGSKNCELHRVASNEMWGDGFYIGAFTKDTNEGGGIFDSSAKANRRVGITITRCKNFIIKDCNFTDTGSIDYTFPSYGIDIEPNPHDYDSIENLKLLNIKTENNLGGGILFVPRNLEYSTNPNALFNITIEKFISKSDGYKEYWLSSALRFVEYLSKKNYTGIIEIKKFDVINQTEAFPFRWERNNNSSLRVKAIELTVDGVKQADYLY